MVFTGPLRVLAFVLVRCPLTGSPFSVPDPAIAIDLDHSLDVHSHFAAKIAFHDIFVLDDLTKLGKLPLRSDPCNGVSGLTPVFFSISLERLRPMP